MMRSDRGAVFYCHLEDSDGGKAKEIPQWMLDRAACCVMSLADEPRVSSDALRRLSLLLKRPVSAEQVAPENQCFPPSGGDADERAAFSEPPNGSKGSVCFSPHRAQVDGAAPGGAPQD
jgi:hypothetical protein